MASNLTAREQELLYAVVDVMKADVRRRLRQLHIHPHANISQIDWKEVASKANFNTAKQARDKWLAVRNKISASVGGGEDGAGTPAKKKATPKKRKAGELISRSTML